MYQHTPSNRWISGSLLSLDLVGSIAAFTLAFYFRAADFDADQVLSNLMLSIAAINFVCFYLLDLYQLNPQTPLWKKPIQTLLGAFAAGCLIVLVEYLKGHGSFDGVVGRGVLIGGQVTLALWAAACRFALSKWLRLIAERSKWLVLGNEEFLLPFVADMANSELASSFDFLIPDGTSAPQLEEAVRQSPIRPLECDPTGPLITLRMAGSWSDLERLSPQNWSGIIVGCNNLNESLVAVLMDMRLRGIRVIDLADFYERIWYKVPVFYLQCSWFAMAQGFQLLHDPIGLRVKRTLDLFGALILLPLVFPIIAIAGIAICLESKGPVFFKQVRVGRGGHLFNVFKLRSMRTDAEKNGAQWASVNDNRVTRVGKFIRATRIDELPQIWNVLRGDMSFIGPRPERPEFTNQLEKDIPFFNLRHILSPGVTGWAQVMYPYGASVEDSQEKLQFDLFYIKNYSLLLDAAIVVKTIKVILFGKGR